MPMDRKRYPKNWDEIARQVKEEADWQCQDCKRYCLKPGEAKHVIFTDDSSLRAKLTLTVHHQDFCPENNERSNLIALCSGCHLRRHRGGKGNISKGQLSLFSHA